jgi:hypothetical protein
MPTTRRKRRGIGQQASPENPVAKSKQHGIQDLKTGRVTLVKLKEGAAKSL